MDKRNDVHNALLLGLIQKALAHGTVTKREVSSQWTPAFHRALPIKILQEGLHTTSALFLGEKFWRKRSVVRFEARLIGCKVSLFWRAARNLDMAGYLQNLSRHRSGKRQTKEPSNINQRSSVQRDGILVTFT